MWHEVSRPVAEMLVKLKVPVYLGRAIDTNVKPPNEAFCIALTLDDAEVGAKRLERELLRRRGVIYWHGQFL